MKARFERFREIAKNCWRLFANEPPPHIFSKNGLLGEERIHVRNDVLLHLKAGDSRPIFIVGAWGSGKTSLVRDLETDLAQEFRYYYRSLFAVSTLNDAYLSLLPRFAWLSLSLLIIAISLWAMFTIAQSKDYAVFKDPIFVAISAAAFLLVTNRMRVFYIAASLTSSILPNKPALTVIDDLERSSLSGADMWTLLSNLWNVNHRYLILLGYDSDKQRSDILERAAKLEGHIVHLPTDYGVNFKIAKSLDGDFSFVAGDFFKRLTPRDITRIFVSVDKEAAGHDNPLYRGCLYANFYFRALLESIGVNKHDYPHIAYQTQVYPDHHKLLVMPRSFRQELSAVQYLASDLSSFTNCLDPKVSDIIARQPEPTRQLMLTSDNVFELRRLFGLFSGVNK